MIDADQPLPDLPGRTLAAGELWPLLEGARGQARPDTQLLCARGRLAREWLGADAQRQQAHGRSAWFGAPIRALEEFLQAAYEGWCADAAARGEAPAALLHPVQERALWRAIVDEQTRDRPLLRGADAAQLAADAWRLAQQWQLPLPFAGGGVDVEQFNRWAASFVRRSARLNALDVARLPSRLAALIEQDRIALPARIVLAGFDEATPAQRALFALFARKVELLRLAPPRRRGVACRRVAADPERELRAAALWARARLERDAGARIGVVVPDLRARRADLQRVFDEVLCPAAQQPDEAAPLRPYNLSLGAPLDQLAPVRAALRLLALRQGTLALDEATALLLSPHWGGSEPEPMQRAELDRKLREDGHLASGLAAWLQAAAHGGADRIAARARRLLGLQDNPPRLPAAEWAQRFAQWLAAAGWPGPRGLDSNEHQALQAWNELLADFAALSAVLPPLTQRAALAQLREAAARRMFQPQTPATPVQVLGPLDTSGLAFDALWIMGLDDGRWPPPARSNPLIPFALQRQSGMPRGSAAQELAFAARLTDRLLQSADEIVLSHAAREDERALAPSALILHLAPAADAADADADALPPRWRQIFASRRTETIDDAEDAPGAALRDLRGGTRLFADQAACPFRAYAIHRLGARAIEEPAPGPTASDRGELVHGALEILWRDIGSREALLALDGDQRRARVAAAVEESLRRLARKAPQRLGAAMRELERIRLAALLESWLAIESARAPFRVLELEGRAPGGEIAGARTIDLHGVPVSIRPDRIDELLGGGRLVIDYKTGQPRGAPWSQERPEEPQLLIYGLQQIPLAGVAFARLRAGETGFRGVAETAEVADGIKPYARELADAASWRAVQQSWDAQLALLAAEIRAGAAGVLPKNPQVCRRCDLQALCRIRESDGARDADA